MIDNKMGVHGLSTFIDDNKNIFLSDHKLYDTRVVIDGSNLCHFLYYHYKISQEFGGDYDHYERKCKCFFNILKECNVTPFVIFDGGYDPDDLKLKTVLKRKKDGPKNIELSGCVLPVLAYQTFLYVLVELNVSHAACVYEADREIAVLAKKWKCPVLSNDSDFFVYSLEGGFMPLDYINLTLCLYNTQTEVSSVLGQNTVAGENELVYIPVKFYKHERLLKVFKKEGDTSILPIFATLVGNDYVDFSVLFKTMLHAPKNPSKKSKTASRKKVTLADIVHWMKNFTGSGEDALEHVLASIKEKKEYVTKLIVKSINEYKDIEEFASFDLESNLIANHTDECVSVLSDGEVASCEHLDCDVIAAGVSELRDYYKRQLPAWFLWRLRNCKITVSFLQNVSVVHRVIFNCQMEMLREISSYACSRDLRALIYAIVLHPVEQSESGKPSKENSVVEYDRLGKHAKEFCVKPTNNLQGLPKLEEIFSLTKMEQKNLLFAGFGVTVESLDKTMDDSSQLLVLVLSFWIKNAQPKATENHLSALIICVLALHIKTLDWFNTKRSSGFDPFKPTLYGDVVRDCEAMDKRKIDLFKEHIEQYFSKPEHTVKRRSNKVVHGFAQFQTCFLNAHYLNQVLRSPVCVPSPSVILNCTFVYNLCQDLESREDPEQHIRDILDRDSPLYRLFTTWKELVSKGNSFEGEKTKNKPKAKKSRTKKEEIKKERVTFNCHVSNKFELLGDSA